MKETELDVKYQGYRENNHQIICRQDKGQDVNINKQW